MDPIKYYEMMIEKCKIMRKSKHVIPENIDKAIEYFQRELDYHKFVEPILNDTLEGYKCSKN